MSSLSNTVNIEIQHPEEWRLSLRIEEKCVRFIANSDIEQDSLISRVVELNIGDDNFLHSLESCIYDNPFFLLDFKQVNIAIHSMRYMLVPLEMACGDMTEKAFAAMYGEPKGDLYVERLENCGVAIVFEIPDGVLPFLNRTFNNPPVHHHLSAICRHFAQKSKLSGVGKEYVYLHDDMADVLIFKKDKFTFANTFECRTADDAVFFILNAWQEYGLDVFNDELQIAGNKSAREAIAPVLRKYVTYVMPAIFPAAAMKIGQDCMKAPFDLILMSLCE